MTLARHGRAIHACPPEPSTLILRSSAAASRRRIQCSLEAPSSFETAERPPQDEGLGRRAPFSSAPRHGRACPGHPACLKRRALPIGITGTRPVMTSRRRSGPRDVLTLFLTGAATLAISLHSLIR